MNETDLLFMSDDATSVSIENTSLPWTILIIDDDPQVHAATRLALLDTNFQNRPLTFVSAFSAAEARDKLPTLHNVAIVLLDVVMETDDAGLTLVRFIREELNWQATRIILRTGQPGSAPEQDVILQYDINDYKAKTELTQTRLFTAVVVALRGYRHLINLETSRAGLRQVIRAAASLHRTRSLDLFAEGVLLQLTAILDTEAHSILCTHRRHNESGTMTVLTGSGRFAGLSADAGGLDSDIRERLATALALQRHVFASQYITLYLLTPGCREVIVYVESGRTLTELDISLLELFGHNISFGYDNLKMWQQQEDTNLLLERRVAERTLRLTQSEADLRRFKSAVEHSSASILITDVHGIITYANPAVLATSQYELDELLGNRASLFKSGMMPDQLFNTLWEQIRLGKSWRGELLNRRKDGTLYWEAVTISPVANDASDVTHFVAVKEEISERKRLEEELRRLATTDPLTGTLNRRSFFERGSDDEFRRQQLDGAAVVMFDVDHFKSINDTFGHAAGDAVLVEIAAICRANLREQDSVGRLGGEEFACLLPGITPSQAELTAEHLRAAVAEQNIVLADGRRTAVTISVGLALFAQGDETLDTVLSRADGALYLAKKHGRNCVRQN
jgi:diguanylate cyclase (GGDEF)-like protein/PAS domain S-box-containing protein